MVPTEHSRPSQASANAFIAHLALQFRIDPVSKLTEIRLCEANRLGWSRGSACGFYRGDDLRQSGADLALAVFIALRPVQCHFRRKGMRMPLIPGVFRPAQPHFRSCPAISGRGC